MGMVGTHQNGDALLAGMEKTIPQKVAVAAAHMELKDGDVVLDAGCANGAATAYFALRYPNVKFIGVDYDKDYVRQANDNFGHLPNIEFIHADMRTLDLGDQKLDAVLNLSFFHEPYSYSGYRAETIREIITAELKNLKPDGVIINRDFVMPDNPDEMVYLALSDDGQRGDTPAEMSFPALLRHYSHQAMSFNQNDPEGHIQGFFLEEQTHRFDHEKLGIPENWRIFYLPQNFAWEFVWRMHYKSRFANEAEEKYGFWTQKDHIEIPRRLGARVTYAAPFENPWITENRYAPHARLFDGHMKPLPLPPSNFISIYNHAGDEGSIVFKEHRPIEKDASYLEIVTFKNIFAPSKIYDMVKRPGGDAIDVVPYSLEGDDHLTIYAKGDYPRPFVNIWPRLMTPNLDRKIWSGHMVEPLATAKLSTTWTQSVEGVLYERAGFSPDDVFDLAGTVDPALVYYTAPAELNERVTAAHIRVKPQGTLTRPLQGRYSGFSHDGNLKALNAHRLLNAAQVGMLAEPRLEANIYALMHRHGLEPEAWIGGQITPPEVGGHVQGAIPLSITSLSALMDDKKKWQAFEPTDERADWLDVVRSTFHEVGRVDYRDRAIAQKEREFVVPNPKQSQNISTNSAMVLCLARDENSDELLIGLQKISATQSQFPAIQERNNYSGHITLPGYRLPSEIGHIQELPAWLSEKTGVPAAQIKKLGDGYFPSLGVMPNRTYLFALNTTSDYIREKCDFIPLREAFTRLDEFEDIHAMTAIFRAVHALGLWEDYTTAPYQNKPRPVTSGQEINPQI